MMHLFIHLTNLGVCSIWAQGSHSDGGARGVLRSVGVQRRALLSNGAVGIQVPGTGEPQWSDETRATAIMKTERTLEGLVEALSVDLPLSAVGGT